MTTMDMGASLQLAQRVVAAREQALFNLEHLDAARTRLRHTRQTVIEGRERRAVMHQSAYARLEARLETMPIIEQAKGVLMARTGCGPDQAFELLKTAAQRANVNVREIAADIVKTVDSVKPARQN
jgi:AmiR/NasT family two-component response regulator